MTHEQQINALMAMIDNLSTSVRNLIRRIEKLEQKVGDEHD